MRAQTIQPELFRTLRYRRAPAMIFLFVVLVSAITCALLFVYGTSIVVFAASSCIVTILALRQNEKGGFRVASDRVRSNPSARFTLLEVFILMVLLLLQVTLAFYVIMQATPDF